MFATVYKSCVTLCIMFNYSRDFSTINKSIFNEIDGELVERDLWTVGFLL